MKSRLGIALLSTIMLSGCASMDEFITGSGIVLEALGSTALLAADVYLAADEAASQSANGGTSPEASSTTGAACGGKLEQCKKGLQSGQYCTVSQKENGVCCVAKHESNGFVVSTSCNNGFGSAT